jgi:acyl-CoA thioester hydrolase
MQIYSHRVKYDEIDGQQIAFNAHYLKWCDQATYELFRSGGFQPSELERKGFDFVVRKATLDYIQPSYFDDLLFVEAKVERIGNSSYDIQFVIVKEDRELVATAILTHVNVLNGKAAPIPGEIRKCLEKLSSSYEIEK